MVDHAQHEIYAWVDGRDNKGSPGLKIHAWKSGYHSSEHALVSYITSQALHGRPVTLFYAFASPDPGVRPYFFSARPVQTRVTALAGFPGLRKIDPETKRKIIGRVFIEVFTEAAKQYDNIGYLAQGTLYPDVIESSPVRGPSATIKSHHNVGGLPELLPFPLLEPLRELFKDEVRNVGRALGLPSHLVDRHPFPGPGLAVRYLGAIEPDGLEILRECDAIFIEELRRDELYQEVSQAFVVLLPIRSVGVQGDYRTYERTIAIRSVNTSDFMTADFSRFTWEFLARVANRIDRCATIVRYNIR